MKIYKKKEVFFEKQKQKHLDPSSKSQQILQLMEIDQLMNYKQTRSSS